MVMVGQCNAIISDVLVRIFRLVVSAIVLCSILHSQTVAFLPRSSLRGSCSSQRDVANTSVRSRDSCHRQHKTSTVLRRTIFETNEDGEGSPSSFPPDLVNALDLADVVKMVTAHCGTYRGQQALLRLVHQSDEFKANSNKNFGFQGTSRRRKRLYDSVDSDDKATRTRRAEQTSICPIAHSADDVVRLYEHVAQAAELIRLDLVPPLYGAECSGPMDVSRTSLSSSTDDDDWLDFASYDDQQWTLEHALQAEQVILKLIGIYEWSLKVSTVAPLLAAMLAETFHTVCDNKSNPTQSYVERLRNLLAELLGAVKFVRVRTIMDVSARSSYEFQLCGHRFRELSLLRERIQGLERKLSASSAATLRQGFDKELAVLKEELAVKEDVIRIGLFQTIHSEKRTIDSCLAAVAELDVIFAKAAFGLSMPSGGAKFMIESSQRGGTILVEQFVHPLLLLKDTPAVPVDLLLGDKGATLQQALIISGSNGGGKSVAMKSFGLASVMTKMALPICSTSMTPRIDFFDQIVVSLGDYQTVQGGESTYTALLSRYTSLIDQVCTRLTNHADCTTQSSILVLLDELGGGTEEASGGAIGQAVVEKLLSTTLCRLVATTHSPRLKTWSFNDPNIGSAAVLLDFANSDKSSNTGNLRYRQPTYKLMYNCIGESYAFGAASRCLPDDVVSRASEIMNAESDPGGKNSLSMEVSYITALSESLEFQCRKAAEMAEAAQELADDNAMIRGAMKSLAASYDEHLARLEMRVVQCYNDLNEQDKNGRNSIHVLGNALSELRTVRVAVKSEEELLREQGLKRLPDSYDLSLRETVVVIDDKSEAYGIAGRVASSDILPPELRLTPTLTSRDVVVILSGSTSDFAFSPRSNNDVDYPRPLLTGPKVFKRYQLAIWDYETSLDGDQHVESIRSIPDSKRRLSSLLSTLDTISASKSSSRTPTRATNGTATSRSRFSSSRERKAARKNSVDVRK